jgi:xanthine phosphoribosyltransferase
MPTAYLSISWDRLHADTLALAERVRPFGPFAGIVAITRGGLVPASILARELNCRTIETVSILTYDGTRRGSPHVAKTPAAAGDGTGWLLVDDLADTGTTAQTARSLLPKAHFACLYAKPDGAPFADTFIADIPQDTWLLFPWDLEPSHDPSFATPD